MEKFQSLSDPVDVSSKTSYDKNINCCERRKTLFKFLKIISINTEDTYNVNFTLYHYHKCFKNGICLNQILLT